MHGQTSVRSHSTTPLLLPHNSRFLLRSTAAVCLFPSGAQSLTDAPVAFAAVAALGAATLITSTESADARGFGGGGFSRGGGGGLRMGGGGGFRMHGGGGMRSSIRGGGRVIDFPAARADRSVRPRCRTSDHGYGRGYGYGRSWGGYGRGVIVHPRSLHWTPSRGLHSHGHMHVPHRGHYHTVPY